MSNWQQALGLGLANPWGQQSQSLPMFSSQAMAQALQAAQYSHACIHANCPICKKEMDSRAKQTRLESEAIAHRKELYEERCQEYMVSWRKRFHKCTNLK